MPVDLVVLGNRRELRDRHQTAGANHHEHDIHDPERRRLEHLGRAVVAPASAAPLAPPAPPPRPARRAQQQRDDHHDKALAEAEPQGRRIGSRSLAIMLAMGITVSAEPAPKPAAVSPAARPRRSGNHFSALPTEAP